MVAIVSGNSLGLSLGTLSVLGARGAFGGATQGRSGEGVYVNAASGNLVLRGQDDLLMSRGLDAAALRTYNSQGLLNDDNGDNWSSGAYAQQLRLAGTRNAAGSTLTLTGRDGAEAVYSWDAASATYVSTDGGGAFDRIAYDSVADEYVWTDGDSGLQERYEGVATGRLVRSIDPLGNTLTYGYTGSLLTSIATASGDTVFFDYDGNLLGQVRTVAIIDGVSVTETRTRYTYDSEDRLYQVITDLTPDDNTDIDGETYFTTYTYEGASTRVAGVTQSDGTSLSIGYIEVNGTWRVDHVTDALGHTTGFSYEGSTTRVTDALGHDTLFTHDSQGRLSQVAGPLVNGARPTTSFAYNANGDLTQVIDPMQRSVEMAYDARGNQILQRDAAGNTVTRSYNATNRLLTETAYLTPDVDGAGPGTPSQPLTTRYVYNAGDHGLLRFLIGADGRVTEHRYNGYGERVATIQYPTASYALGSLGVTDVPTEAQLTSWAANQELELSVRTDFGYDVRGQIATTTQYATVDAAGEGVEDAGTSVTTFVRDRSGLLLNTLTPNGVSTTYTYDGLGRVLTTEDDAGHITVTLYDDANRSSTVTLVNGLATTSTFDAAGRLVSVTQGGENAPDPLSQTRYFYDAADRLVMTTDPTGIRHWFYYDEAGRKVADVEDDGTLTEYSYNASGQLTRTIVYHYWSPSWSLVDDFGLPVLRPLAELRPPADVFDEVVARSLRSWQAYDDAGRLTRSVDVNGQVTTYTYDGDSRLILTRVHAGRLEAADLALLGLAPSEADITPPANPSGGPGEFRATRRFYSAEGLLVGELDAEGYYIRHDYDGATRLVASTAYARRVEGILVDDLTPPVVVGQNDPAPSTAFVRASTATTPSAIGDDQVSRRFYNTKGQVAAEVDAEGYFTEYAYDIDGHVTNTTRYATRIGSPLSLATQLSDIEVVVSQDGQDQTTTATYDDLGRIETSTNHEGTLTRFAYDDVGNLVSTTVAEGTVEVRSLRTRYDLQGRVVQELSAEGAALLDGNLTQAEIDDVWEQHAVTHTYDAAGRRASTTDQNGHTTLFYYDSDGRLVTTINHLGEVEHKWYNPFGLVYREDYFATRISTAGLTGGRMTIPFEHVLFALPNQAMDRYVLHWYLEGTTLKEYVAHSVTYDGNHNNLNAYLTHNDYDAYNAVAAKYEFGNDTEVSVEQYTYDKRGALARVDLNPGGGNSAYADYTYDAFGRLTRTDRSGQVTEQHYDRVGRVVQTIDPSGAGRSTSYDAFDRILSQTNALGRTTTYRYDAQARSVTTVTPEGIEFVTTYTRHGQTQSVVGGRRDEVFVEGPNGSLTRVLDPSRYTTHYEYDRDGRLERTTRDGVSTTQAFDDAGRLETTTDANGNEVHYTYDAANRVLSVTVDPGVGGLNLTTQYRYNAFGQASWTCDPEGVWTQTEYNLRGDVTAVIVDPVRGPDWADGQPDDNPDGLALATRYTYDEFGHQLSVTTPGGVVTRYGYDSRGWRIGETVDPDGANLIKTYDYDARGNVVAVTEGTAGAGQSVTRFVYDDMDRLRVTVDATGGVELRDFNEEGLLVRTTRLAAPVVVDDLLNAAGIHPSRTVMDWELASAFLADPARRDPTRDMVDTRLYDRDNRLAYAYDAEGGLVRYQRDGDGNVTLEQHFANRMSDPAIIGQQGMVDLMDPERDLLILRDYDTLGREVLSRTAGSWRETRYDGNGNVLEQVTYADRSGDGHPIPDVTRDFHVRYTYDAANRQVYAIDGVGSFTRNEYDDDGRLLRQTAYARRAEGLPVATPNGPVGGGVVGQAAVLDWEGWLEAGGFESTSDRVTHFVYDTAGRMTHAVDATRAVTERSYDNSGNVVRQTQLATVLASSVAIDGNIASQLDRNAAIDRTTHAVFDSAGRLHLAVDAMGAVTRYGYDALGRLTETVALGRPVSLDTNLVATEAAIESALLEPSALTFPADRRTLQLHDRAGRVVFAVDALGYVTRNTYDGIGQMASSTRYAAPTDAQAPGWGLESLGTEYASYDPTLDRRTLFDHDAAGNLVSTTDALGATETTLYDGRNLKLSFTNKKGSVWTYQHDGAGNLRLEVGPPVGVTAVTRDARGNLVNGITHEVSIERRFEYDALGQLVGDSLNGSPETRYEYDAIGRQVRVFYPGVEVYADEGDNLATNGLTGDARASLRYAELSTETFYDVFGNAVANVDVAGNASYKLYDAAGRVTHSIDAMGYVTGYGLNTFGEVETLTRFNASTTLADGPVTAATMSRTADHVMAALGTDRSHDRQIHTQYDLLGRAISVVEPDGYTYAYDANVDPEDRYSDASKATNSVYNAFGEVVQQVVASAPSGTVVSRTSQYFDAMGRNVATVDAAGYLTRREFDSVGNLRFVREFARQGAAPAEDSWRTMPVEPLPLAGSPNRITEHVYDVANRKTLDIRHDVTYHEVTTTAGSNGSQFPSVVAITTEPVRTEYRHDAVGNLIATIEPGGGTTYSYYDALGRVTAVAAPARPGEGGIGEIVPITLFYRDGSGNVVKKIELSGGPSSVEEFDGVSHLSDAEVVFTGSTPYTAVVGSTGFPELVLNVASDRTTYAAYDTHGHVVQTTDASGYSEYRSYNERGELAKSWQGVSSPYTAPVYDTNGRLLATSTVYKVFQYDKVGNLVKIIEPGSANGMHAITPIVPAPHLSSISSGRYLEFQGAPAGYHHVLEVRAGGDGAAWEDVSGVVQNLGGGNRRVDLSQFQYTPVAPGVGANETYAYRLSLRNGAGQTLQRSTGEINFAGEPQVTPGSGEPHPITGLRLETVNGTAHLASDLPPGAITHAMLSAALLDPNLPESELPGYPEIQDSLFSGPLPSPPRFSLASLLPNHRYRLWLSYTVGGVLHNAVAEVRLSLNRLTVTTPPYVEPTRPGVYTLQDTTQSSLDTTPVAMVPAPQLLTIGTANYLVTQAPPSGQTQRVEVRMGNSDVWEDVSHLMLSTTSSQCRMDLSNLAYADTDPEQDSFEIYEYRVTNINYTSGDVVQQATGRLEFRGGPQVWQPPVSAGNLIPSFGVGGGFHDPETQTSFVRLTAEAPGTPAQARLRYRKIEVTDDDTPWDEAVWQPTEGWNTAFDGPLVDGHFEYYTLYQSENVWDDGPYEIELTMEVDGLVYTARRYFGNWWSESTFFRNRDPIDQPGRWLPRDGTYQQIDTTASSLYAPAAIVKTQAFNAFGEMVSRGLLDGSDNEGVQEHFDYDDAGRLWRTNTGDGVERIFLYDVQGRMTAEIRNAGSGGEAASGMPDIADIGDVRDVAQRDDVRRTDYVRDALGNVTLQIDPRRRVVSEGGSAVRQLSAAVTGWSSAQLLGVDGTPTPQWSGANTVNLSWSDLGDLGGGNVRVTIDYQSLAWVIPGIDGAPDGLHQSIPLTERQIFTSSQARAGVAMSWTRPSWTQDFGLSAVHRVVVEKQDATGQWQLIVLDVTDLPDPNYGKALDTAIPSDGEAGEYGMFVQVGSLWLRAGANFGNVIRFDMTGSTASYNYQIRRYLPGAPENSSDPAHYEVIRSGVADPNAPASVTDPIVVWRRPEVAQTFDRWGNVLTRTDARDEAWVSSFAYNHDNQLISQQLPATDLGQDSPETLYFYDVLGRQIGVRDALGNLNAQEFDDAGNVVREIHADGGVARNAFNAFGNRVRAIDAESRAIEYQYDRMGRVQRSTHDAVDVRSTIPVEESGPSLSLPSEPNMQRLSESSTYDQLGRKLSQTNGANETIRYRYDLAGNVVETIDAEGYDHDYSTKSFYNGLGRKVGELDALGNGQQWTYDYFGRLKAHTNLGGRAFTYQYDNAGQLVSETSGAVLTAYGYDAAGQQTSVRDNAQDLNTSYVYDLGGRRVSERVVHGATGAVYQDNQLAYDAQGRLRVSSDGSVHLAMEYDAAGNRTRIRSFTVVRQSGGIGNGVRLESDRHFKYDAMNRQTVVDAVDETGEIGQVGHIITYDKTGNRTSDTYYGNRIVLAAEGHWQQNNPNSPPWWVPATYSTQAQRITDTYAYDAMGRLTDISHDGQLANQNFYDAASRVAQSGTGDDISAGFIRLINTTANGAMASGLNERSQRYQYDKMGRVIFQTERTTFSNTDAGVAAGAGSHRNNSTSSSYDSVGNLRHMWFDHRDDEYVATYDFTYQGYDSYKLLRADGSASGDDGHTLNPGSWPVFGIPPSAAAILGVGAGLELNIGSFDGGVGTTHFTRNAHGVLLDTRRDGNVVDSYVNDAQGQVLQANAGGDIKRSLIVNGQVLGNHGVIDGTPQADFDISWNRINGQRLAQGSYTVRPGDTLRSVARIVYGDESLWYRLADANGLAGEGSRLVAGQVLAAPTDPSDAHNNVGTYKSYNEGALLPSNIPQIGPPGEPCGGNGKVIVQVVAIVVTAVVTYFTWGAGTSGCYAGMTAALQAGEGAAIGAAVAGAVAGNVAGQLTGMAIGTQQDFNWKSVAVAGAGALVTQGLSSWMPTGNIAANAAVRAALGNAVAQGVGVVTGLQQKFDWRGVATASVAAGMTANLAPSLQDALKGFEKTSQEAAANLLTGVVRSAATAVVQGGDVELGQVATDVFGNMLASSLIEVMQPDSWTPPRYASVDDREKRASGDILVNGKSFSETVWDKEYERQNALQELKTGRRIDAGAPAAKTAAVDENGLLKLSDGGLRVVGDSWSGVSKLWTSVEQQDIMPTAGIQQVGKFTPVFARYPYPTTLPALASTTGYVDEAGTLYFKVVAPGVDKLVTAPTAAPATAHLDRVEIVAKRDDTFSGNFKGELSNAASGVLGGLRDLVVDTWNYGRSAFNSGETAAYRSDFYKDANDIGLFGSFIVNSAKGTMGPVQSIGHFGGAGADTAVGFGTGDMAMAGRGSAQLTMAAGTAVLARISGPLATRTNRFVSSRLLGNTTTASSDVLRSLRPTGASEASYDALAGRAYDSIRANRMSDVATVAENAGMSATDVATMKKHLFFGRHEYAMPDGTLVRSRFEPDMEIAVAWRTAQTRPLVGDEAAWFQQLARHELGERQLMSQGLPYRAPDSWGPLGWSPTAPGAHNLAPPPTLPGNRDFPGFDILNPPKKW